MTPPRYPFSRPAVPEPAAWLPFLEEAYAARWFTNGGPVAARLEAAIADRCASTGREAVLVSSATSGLVAALLALGLRGAVALPSFTFPATAHAVALAGCTPVFCDVDPDTWELDPASVEHAVRLHDCSAILSVRPYGLCRPTAALERVAARAGIPLVLDSAAAFGGRLAGGDPAGGGGDVEVFSFHATKVFAVGEGGVVLAPAPLAARIRHTANFAIAGTAVTGPGLNAKLGELPAAVGLAMLARLDDHIARRVAAVERLARAARRGRLVTLPERVGAPPWQGLPMIAASPRVRDEAVAALHAAGVEARCYYSPGLHRTAAFRDASRVPLPVTEALADRILCLPVYSDLTGGELDEICAAVEAALSGATASGAPATAPTPVVTAR